MVTILSRSKIKFRCLCSVWNKYTVRFLVEGTLIDEVEVSHGNTATTDKPVTKDGYDHIGWDKDPTNITAPTDLNAVFKKKVYTVTFKDDDVTLVVRNVEHGEDAIPPEEPQKDNFIFDGWDTPFTNVTSNLVVKATYKPDPYTITFTGLTKEGVLSWNSVPGETRFDVKIDEYETGAYSNSISLSAGAIGVASRHTKVTVSVGEYRGVTYVDRYGNQDYSFSQGEAPLLQTPSGFKIVNQEVEGRVYYYLQFDRVANDAPANRAPAYLMYYWDQSRDDQSQVAIADTIVSYLLTGLNWGPSSQTIKIVLRGYGEFGNSVAASIHITKNSDGSFVITE